MLTLARFNFDVLNIKRSSSRLAYMLRQPYKTPVRPYIHSCPWVLSEKGIPVRDDADMEGGRIADATLNKVKHFTIGFAVAGDTPAAKGSGVLVRYGDQFGILTCAHVDQYLRKLKRPVGIVRLNRGPTDQYGMLDLGDVFTQAAYYEPWTAGEEDIAFIRLSPDLVGNIKKDCTFLDAEKNFTKPEPENISSLIPVYSVFGLVEDFTGTTTRQGGRATTWLKGVLTSGALRNPDPKVVTLECFEQNLPDLPNSFGGTSGGGLWRVYVRKNGDGSVDAVHHRLIGIASNEDTVSSPPRIICQGPARIEAMLKTCVGELAAPT